MSLFTIIRKRLKLLLWPFALIYGGGVWLRNKLYDLGIFRSVKFGIPVISVGNLSTGGTGKTPHIEYLIQLLRGEFRVATLSRGYKRESRGFQLAESGSNALLLGDEPMQFYYKFPEITVSVCADRVEGILELTRRRPETEVILLDDAYQHRAVQAGLNILITDYHLPFYQDSILPGGNLREGKSSYVRADIIIVSKCPESLSAAEAEDISRKINPLRRQQVLFSTIRYSGFRDFLDGREIFPGRGQNYLLVSGIARPEPLLDYLRQTSASVCLLRYPDHHYFTEANLEDIYKAYREWAVENKVIIISEKDAMRLLLHRNKISEWGIPVYVLAIEIRLINQEKAFNSRIRDYIRGSQQDHRS